MYYDLERLVETFKNKTNDFPIGEDGKHLVPMEDIIDYLEYLINDDDYFD